MWLYLKRKSHESLLELSGYDVEFCHRDDSHGGVALYCHCDIPYSLRRDLHVNSLVVESIY